MRNEIIKGLFNVFTENQEQEEVITLEIHNTNTRITPIYSEDQIKFDVIVNTEVTIGELGSKRDYISEPGRYELKKLAEKSLESDMERTFTKIKEEFGLDIFGFGNIIRQRNPKLWKSIEDQWDEIFADLELNIKCNIHIRNSGHFSKPIEVNN